MTFATGLTTERKLAGLVVLSSYLPIREKIKSVSPPGTERNINLTKSRCSLTTLELFPSLWAMVRLIMWWPSSLDKDPPSI